MADIDLDAITARAEAATYRGGDEQVLAEDTLDLLTGVRRLTAACRTIGKALDDAMWDVAAATRSQDLLDEDRDGDWGLIFERLAMLGDRAERAEATLAEVAALADESGSHVSCGGLTVDADGCFAGVLARKIRAILARAEQTGDDRG